MGLAGHPGSTLKAGHRPQLWGTGCNGWGQRPAPPRAPPAKCWLRSEQGQDSLGATTAQRVSNAGQPSRRLAGPRPPDPQVLGGPRAGGRGQGRPGLTCNESTGRGRGQLCSEWNGTGEGRPAAPSSQQPLLWGGDPMEPSPAPQGPPADIRTVAAAPAKGPPTPAPVQCVLNSAGEARVQPLPAPGNQAARQGCYPSPQAAGLGRPPGAWSVR